MAFSHVLSEIKIGQIILPPSHESLLSVSDIPCYSVDLFLVNLLFFLSRCLLEDSQSIYLGKFSHIHAFFLHLDSKASGIVQFHVPRSPSIIIYYLITFLLRAWYVFF